MTVGWLFLGAMIAIYGVANFFQSMGASRVSVHHTLDPILLFKLAGQRTYLLGVACQLVGYLLAVFARRDLPLFLVQASVAAGLGVTAVLGVLVLKWRLPRTEVVLLVLLIVGVTALVLSAHPGPPREVTESILVGLVDAHHLGDVVSDPLLYLLLGHSVVGQLLFGLALQRGSTTAAVAAMDAAFSAPPAAVDR